ncbi:hypothetical protein PHLGIDRAFT_27363 [Phlebiopsis gigantea 11061_1 CR5-6]|uniref:Dystroglycan-type cadherin-like domain-containing protein n=1 Tax=Phlebiopsis gigantea (strain 11061_1 CR5-6) TaxID=745531 RepID=A0A0C3SFS3_PHLG1|nr:hypothetical protein PHLGIDRAFT_27363 [Phlebiopsis gigantea 11061_1 CR5-6]
MPPSRLRLLFLGLCCCFGSPQAQTLYKGQVFTNGLAIFDSPAPNSVLHAGSSMSLAIDVSGDGKLSQPGFSSAGFDSLDIFLVSSETNINLTVIAGSEFLLQEQGSTVKHLNWPIPTCVQPGSYNITLYETSHMSSVQYFSITPITLTIENNSPSGSCSSTNALFAQPQASSPFPENPFLEDITTASSPASPQTQAATVTASSSPSFSSQDRNGALTVTVGPSGLQWPLTIASPQETVPIIVGPSDYNPLGTVTVTASIVSTDAGQVSSGMVTVVVTPTSTPTPVTVVLVSMDTETLTTTVSGQAAIFTTVETTYSTTTAFVNMPNMDNPDYAGFLPINSAIAPRRAIAGTMFLVWTVLYTVVLFLLV